MIMKKVFGGKVGFGNNKEKGKDKGGAFASRYGVYFVNKIYHKATS